jgi:hypothetical protein
MGASTASRPHISGEDSWQSIQVFSSFQLTSQLHRIGTLFDGLKTKVTLQVDGTFHLRHLIHLRDAQSQDEEAINETYKQLKARFDDDDDIW